MAGSLIKVDEFTVSSAVASVILGGGSSGSSGLNASTLIKLPAII